jgi:hypothetical protein
MLYKRVIESMKEREIILTPGVPIVLNGTISRKESDDGEDSEGESFRIMVDEVNYLKELMKQEISDVIIYCDGLTCSVDKWQKIRNFAENNPGETQLVVCYSTENDEHVFIDTQIKFMLTYELFNDLKAMFDEKHIKLKAKPFVGKARRVWNSVPKDEVKK